MSDTLPVISVVVPCYNEQEAVPFFAEKIAEVAEKMPECCFEYIFVDDGSNDDTLAVLRRLCEDNPAFRYVSFSRNFGKEAAMLAGLEAAAGDYIAVMDADLQDPPDLLPQMYAAITQEGFDCVATRRVTRKGEPRIRSLFAKSFYRLINKISDTKMVDGARDFRLMTRQMVDSVLSLREYNRFSKGLLNWVGFRTKWIVFENVPRVAGKTKWSFWGLFLYALDGISAFSVKPLAISSLFGLFFCVISFLFVIVIVVRRLIFGDPVDGWASTASIILFVGGIQLFCTGILGQYLAKIYMESKRRPMYIVRDSSEKNKRNK